MTTWNNGRRTFLKRATAGTIGGVILDDLFGKLSPVSATESKLPAGAVRFQPEIEPLVRLIEETPRERVIEEIASRVAGNRISYQELLAALLLAGVRNIQPRPSVGFKFHAVLVVNSAHIASLASPDSDRWLPIFWALDNFKGSQARDTQEGDWTMTAVDESSVPAAHQAMQRFRTAMADWDESAADVATAAISRGHSSNAIFDAYAEFAARDFRSIGHKVIYLANAYRTLDSIGWQYSEPVLRSLTYAILNHVGEPDPATSDLAADLDGRINRERIVEIRDPWLDGRDDSAATAELVQALRSVSSDDASRLVVEQLNRGVSSRSIYDALFASAAELTMRQPAIVPLHAMTTTNAMHYTFQTCTSDATRRFLLLQNASFIAQFREAAKGRGKLADLQIDSIEPSAPWSPDRSVGEVFEKLGTDPQKAASLLLAYLQDGQPATDAMNHARRLIFLKGNDSHDYKYSSAVLEDFHQVTPAWRNRYLAAALYKMRNASEPTTPLVGRIQSALPS
jgi:hypothetical protein